MDPTSTPPGPDLQSVVQHYLQRLHQIDAILREPVNTLVAAPVTITESGSTHPRFPTWFVDDEPTPADFDKETQALCCLTVQRLRRVHRRLAWLDAKAEREIKELCERLVQSLVPAWTGGSMHANVESFHRCLGALCSETYGGLNPLTASLFFRVLMEEGEKHAHRGIGFLAFFAMIWPLHRRYPDSLNVGIRIEPSEPTAYITAKCLIPVLELKKICEKRAALLGSIEKRLVALTTIGLIRFPSPYQRWQFNEELEDLRSDLFFLSNIAIDRDAFRTAQTEIGKVSDSLTLDAALDGALTAVLTSLETVVRAVSKTSAEVLAESSEVLRQLRNDLVKNFRRASVRRLTRAPYSLLLNKAYQRDERRVGYANDLARAAEEALKFCDAARQDLDTASSAATKLKVGSEIGERRDGIRSAFSALSRSNTHVAKGFDELVRPAARWCKTIVDREVAFASAHNITDFDPAELVSGIAVAVRSDLMTTPIQVRDAVKRALQGVWSDGSWRLGRPFFTAGALGTWPPTADVLWTLTSAIGEQPSVTDADEALFSYVDWLERTKRTVTKGEEKASGWSADRVREPRRIHLPTTALNINVLLEIRNIVEHRLWELCEKRFTVPRDAKQLASVFPVDLNRRHDDRLHSGLARMAREARHINKGGTYSIVLHGPPGSSKTALAEALSREMWRETERWGLSKPRMVRITPADFTRLGEDRIDSEARLIFDLLSHVRSATILFDEIDDLLLRREGTARRFMDLVTPAMLNRLQDLRSACPHQEICFVFGTNFVENIEPALMRRGRIDKRIAVVYPDWHSRLATIGRHLDRLTEKLDAAKTRGAEWERLRRWVTKWTWRLARKTGGWPWLVLDAFAAHLASDMERRIASMTHPLSGTSRASLREFRSAINEQYDREHARLAEPAYGGRLLRRFDSPDLLAEYAMYLLAQGSGPEEVEYVVARGRGEVQSHVEARFPLVEQDQQMILWEKQIAPELRKVIELQRQVTQPSLLVYPRSAEAVAAE